MQGKINAFSGVEKQGKSWCLGTACSDTSGTDCSDSMVPITPLRLVPIQRYRQYILFTFPTEMRVENVHFCPITAFLPFLFLPSEGVKTALEATFSALLITFSASPR